MWGYGKRGRYDSDDSDVEMRAKSPKVVDESLVKNKISKLFAQVENSKGSGSFSFAIHGVLPQAPNTAIKLKDGTVVKFPVLEEELGGLIPKFEESCFGRGEDTVLDKNVRDSLELKPGDFEIINNQWENFLTRVLIPKISKELDIETPINANLYKLLLYKPGSFFDRHRDSEKENRMFGTLVIQLPSKFSGGQLVVHHDGKTKTFDSSSKSKSEEFNTYFSAFYCDCEHEVTKLTEGIRICLIYNLVLTGEATAELPRASSMSTNDSKFIALVNEWKKEQMDEGIIVGHKKSKAHDHSYNAQPLSSSAKSNDEDVPEKLVYMLSHQYTQENLLYKNLKAGDKAVATMLKNLAVEANLCVMMGILEKTTEGECCGGEFDSSDEDCMAEKDYAVKYLRLLSADKDIATGMTKMTNLDKHVVSTFEDEIIPLNRLRALEPYKKNREHTGNEGVRITLQYRTAVLIIFQKESFISIIANKTDTGLQFSEQYFLNKFKKFESDPNNTELKADVLGCLEFMKKVSESGIESYTTTKARTRTAEQLMELLNALIYLNDLNLLSKFFIMYRECVIDHFDQMLPALMKLSSKFGCDFVSKEVFKIVHGMNDVEKAIAKMKAIVDIRDDAIDKTQQMTICRETVKIILDNLRKREMSTAAPLKLMSVMMLYDVICFVNDSALFSNFFLQRAVINHVEKIIPQLINLSGSLGWSFVSNEIMKIFQRTKDEMRSLGILKTLVETVDDNNAERLESCREFAKIVMNDIQQREKNGRGNLMTPVFKQIEFLNGFCDTAIKIKVDFSDFFKSRDASVASTVLRDLAAKNNNILDEPWLQIAKEWVLILKTAASKILIEPDWRKRTDFVPCGDTTCKDCSLMRRFMIGDEVTRLFNVTPKRQRDHLENKLRMNRDLSIVPGRIGTSGSKWTLSVTKLKNSAHLAEVKAKNLARERFTQLNSILSASGVPIEGLEEERIIIFLDQ